MCEARRGVNTKVQRARRCEGTKENAAPLSLVPCPWLVIGLLGRAEAASVALPAQAGANSCSMVLELSVSQRPIRSSYR